MTKQEKFEKWMKENGAWEEFKANFHNAMTNVNNYTLNGYISVIVERGLIAGAFDWTEYSDGNVVWRALDVKWLEYLDEKDK